MQQTCINTVQSSSDMAHQRNKSVHDKSVWLQVCSCLQSCQRAKRYQGGFKLSRRK